MKLRIALIFILVLGFTGYKLSPYSAEPYAATFEQLMKQTLQPGDERAKILNYFEARNISCRWSQSEKRMECALKHIPSGTWLDHTMIVYVYLDDENRFKSATAEDTFTFI